MFKVFCLNKSSEDVFEFFSTDSMEDAVQVGLNLHKGCNVEHRISVYDVEGTCTLINFFSENYD